MKQISAFLLTAASVLPVLWFQAYPAAVEYTARDEAGNFLKPFVTTTGNGQVEEVYGSTAQLGLAKTVASYPRQ